MTTAQQIGEGLYDKHGREIMVGDVVKVFHFIGARGKRYYMYKQVIRDHRFKDESAALVMGHLDMTGDHYFELKDGRARSDYEIVQSIDAAFEDRPKLRDALGEG